MSSTNSQAFSFVRQGIHTVSLYINDIKWMLMHQINSQVIILKLFTSNRFQ